ncbi:hypothetical protein BD626DRAFT_502637, partial [Schizophyllum amplum]
LPLAAFALVAALRGWASPLRLRGRVSAVAPFSSQAITSLLAFTRPVFVARSFFCVCPVTIIGPLSSVRSLIAPRCLGLTAQRDCPPAKRS